MQNGAHDNWVQLSNDMGTNRDYDAALAASPDGPAGGSQKYLALPNTGDGIALTNAYTNTIGGYIGTYEANNFVNNNLRSGIYIAAGSHHNTIGLNDVRDNVIYGILLDGDNTAYNTITRTAVFSNGLDGIGERNSATLNVWTEVSIHDNGGLGIDKQASDDGQNIIHAPNNFGFDSINRATGVIHGHADPAFWGRRWWRCIACRRISAALAKGACLWARRQRTAAAIGPLPILHQPNAVAIPPLSPSRSL